MAADSSSSYSQILKSSSLIGGAQGVNLLIGIVRTKFVAILIGPIGIGLVGTYQAIQGMVGTVAGLGIQSSAVRDVAVAVGNGELVAGATGAMRIFSQLHARIPGRRSRIARLHARRTPLCRSPIGVADHPLCAAKAPPDSRKRRFTGARARVSPRTTRDRRPFPRRRTARLTWRPPRR